jgi:hypothetical protein
VASTKGGKTAGSDRDCAQGQGPFCTWQAPCTPCDAGGCKRCSNTEFGNCRFVASEDVGPYCAFPLSAAELAAGVGRRLPDGSRVKVKPCEKCCSP